MALAADVAPIDSLFVLTTGALDDECEGRFGGAVAWFAAEALKLLTEG